MIRSLLLAAAVAYLGSAFSVARADEKSGKELTITGTLSCGKCKLKLTGVTKCVNALSVKEGEKTVVYLLNDKGNGETYHECGGDEKARVSVTGLVTEKDGQKWIKPSKVDVKK